VDLTFHNALALRVRGAGDPRTRSGWRVNMQGSDQFVEELWSAPLVTLRNDGGWEDAIVPFRAFCPQTAGAGPGEPMDRRRIWMVGVSVLAQHGAEGLFELGLHSVRAIVHEEINEEDFDDDYVPQSFSEPIVSTAAWKAGAPPPEAAESPQGEIRIGEQGNEQRSDGSPR